MKNKEKKMKKQILFLAAVIIFLNAWAAINVSAQWVQSVKVDIAFDFKARGKTFPAGTYRIESISRGADNLLVFRDGGGKTRLIIADKLYAGTIQQPKLVFERRGENFQLTGIFLESGQWGFSLPAKREKSERYVSSSKTEKAEVLLSK
jgi:hypothetical protein